MNINQLNTGVSTQIAQFREHLKECQTAAAIHQCYKKYEIDNGCTVKVLLQNNACSLEDKAFVKISHGTEAIQETVKTIFKDTFPLTFLSTLKPVWISTNVCHYRPQTLSAER